MSLLCGWMGRSRLFSQSSRRKDLVCSAGVKQVMGKPPVKGSVNNKAAALEADRLRVEERWLWGLLSVSWGAETPQGTSPKEFRLKHSSGEKSHISTQLRGKRLRQVCYTNNPSDTKPSYRCRGLSSSSVT